MKKSTSIGLIICALLTACGTLNTLPKTDEEISSDLRKQKTYCSEVPRVYSGVSYDMCVLNAAPKNSINDEWILGLFAIDLCASAIADTVALPFTIPAQSNNGSIEITH